MPLETETDQKRISARQWMKRINRSLKFRNQVRDKQNWKRILDEYKGEYKVNASGVNSPPINLVYGYVHTAIPRIYFRDPYMSINPKGGNSVTGARITELAVNYLFRELNLKNETYRLLMDVFLYGHGWFKYGYIGVMGQTQCEAPSEESEYIKDEEIFVSYVPYEDIAFDVTLSKDPPHDCRWIAHSIIRPLAEIKNDPKYENTGALRSNITTRESNGDKLADTLKDSDLDLFEFWEVHDKDTNKIYCVCDGTDKYLREDDNTYEMKGLPFSMLKFNLVPGEPYPLSDIFLIEAQILERVKLRAAQINHIKRWSRQLSIEEGAMDKEEIEKFAQGIDGAVTQRKKGTEPPSPIQYADIQKESFQIDDLIQRDIDSVIGQNETDRGGVARTTTKTKFELQEQTQGSGVRQAQRQDKLEDFLEEVAMKVISLIKQFQTTPRYVAITGMKPEQIAEAFGQIPGVQIDGNGIRFTKEAIQGEYDVDAKAGSTLPLNRENKVKLLEGTIGMFEVLGIAPGSPTSIAVAKALFRELDLKEVEDAFDQQVQQAQAQEAQMQQAQAAGLIPPGNPGQPQQGPNPGAPQPQGGPQQEPNVSHVVHHNAPQGMPQ